MKFVFEKHFETENLLYKENDNWHLKYSNGNTKQAANKK